MTGLVRNATLLTVAGLLAASAAMAGVPSAAKSSILALKLVGAPPVLTLAPTSNINLVGASGSPAVSDFAAGLDFTVIVRDLANVPMNNASVVLDFIAATDLKICDDQNDAAATQNCAFKTTRKFTDATGTVKFTVVGGSNGSTPLGVSNAAHLVGDNVVKVYANGTLIGSIDGSAFDLDSSSGVGANDLSSWVTDFGSTLPWARSDFDGDGGVGANDLSSWVTVFGATLSSSSCVTSCQP